MDVPSISDYPERCADTSEIEGDDSFEVGDCVRTHHAGESASLLGAERIACERSPATTDAG